MTEESAPPASAALSCRNCGAVLSGPYCAQCGQRHEPHIHSLGHFLAEAFESVTHADSRLWRTLRALVVRPGYLTREFFAGRRASFLPPVRFYLVVSVLFFLIAGFATQSGDGIVQIDGTATTETAAAPAKRCEGIKYQGPFQEWVQPRLATQCRKALTDGGRSLGLAFLNNLPRALFVLLPFLAGVMMLLYWRPRRHYVEHLLFMVHNHGLLFVGYGLLLLLDLALPDNAFASVLALLFHAYLLWYFYRGLRVVYGQSRGTTLFKYFLLGVVYLVSAGTLVTFTLLLSAMTF